MGEDKVKELREMKKRSRAGGGAERVEMHRMQGKMTARERVDTLLDPGSFVELDPFVSHQAYHFGMEKQKMLGDGVVTGHGTIEGQQVFVYAQDFTVFAGSVGRMHAQKICKVIDLAMMTGCPIIALFDSGGARLQEGVDSLAGYGDVMLKHTLASGVIPQIAMVMGPCAGSGVYAPHLCDFVFMVKEKACMFMVSPDVIKVVQKEEVTLEELGGASVHASHTGSAHFVAEDDMDCIKQVRRLLGYLPYNNLEQPRNKATGDDPERREDSLDTIIPEDPMKPYDMKEVVRKIVDKGEFLEVHELYARNIIVGFARMDGSTVGIVANQPMVLAGTLDTGSSLKAARFVRFCDAFNIPLITLVDVPGYMPSVEQENSSLLRDATKLLYAYAEASTPKVTVITRKAIGGAYCVMGSKHLRTDINLAWPTAEIAIVGPEGAINIVFKQELIMADDPQEKRDVLISEYRKLYASAFFSAERGYLDDIIEPNNTRMRLIEALTMLDRKRENRPAKKHGNMPL
ncbi:MAG TPA: acyl-CoA carboxylase subunit beta [Methanomassiliicoccales archaeon]|nr:acyl-CoA carboxylase subunit beta [Methanomassiliicoccales archaeon]